MVLLNNLHMLSLSLSLSLSHTHTYTHTLTPLLICHRSIGTTNSAIEGGVNGAAKNKYIMCVECSSLASRLGISSLWQQVTLLLLILLFVLMHACLLLKGRYYLVCSFIHQLLPCFDFPKHAMFFSTWEKERGWLSRMRNRCYCYVMKPLIAYRDIYISYIVKYKLATFGVNI